MAEYIIPCVGSFLLGVLITIIFLRREILRVYSLGDIEKQMIFALINDQGGGDDIVGILAENGIGGDLSSGGVGGDQSAVAGSKKIIKLF